MRWTNSLSPPWGRNLLTCSTTTRIMFRDSVSLLALVLIPLLVVLHLLVSPYTKVEESFHVQAVHDLLTYGVSVSEIGNSSAGVYLREHYDHFQFPGAVPRTFVGDVVLAGLSLVGTEVTGDWIDGQVLARGILGLINAGALVSYSAGVRRAFGQTTAVWYLLFQASQFHVLYYASRTLSNMFAFGVSTLALRALLPNPTISADKQKARSRLALCLLTIAGIVFRSELALFLATHTLFLLGTGCVGLRREIIPAGIVGLLIGLGLTVPIDSFLWQDFPLWPELAAFKFNVVHGQASAWGTQPWHFYFSNAIPRLLLNPCTYLVGIPLALGQPSTRIATGNLLTPSLAFVALFSLQPHKEWRFILYAVPPFTAAAALGAGYVWTHRTKSLIYRVLALGMLLSPIVTFCLSTFVLLPSSAANYPGAYALRSLHNHHLHHHHHRHASAPEEVSVSVYLGNLACQTGVTRFLQHPSPAWRYDKTENETIKADPSFWTQFHYVLVEANSPEEGMLGSDWEDVETVYGFAGLRILRPSDEARVSVETQALRALGVLEIFESSRDLARSVTKGWWVELRMEPRIRILRSMV